MYKFNDTTLLHSVGFNPFKLENILKYGILSKNEAKKENITFTRNLEGYNFSDYISMTRYMYVNFDDENSSYAKYSLKGISLIVENQDFIFNKDEMYFNYADEVLVKDKVDIKNIKGIMLPEKYLDYELKELPMIPLKSTSYINIKHTCDDLIAYLKTYNHEVSKEEYNNYLEEMYYTLESLKQEDDPSLIEDFNEIKYALDEFISNEVQLCFNKVLKKENTTLQDMVSYINNKTLNLDVFIAQDIKKRGR